MKNIRHMRVMACILAGIFLGLVAIAQAQEVDTEQSELQLHIEIVNELSNPVPDNSFIEGEVIFIRGILLAPQALDAKAELERAEAQVQALQETPDPQPMVEANESESSARERFTQLVDQLTETDLVQQGLAAISVDFFGRDDQGNILAKAAVNIQPVTDESRLGVGYLTADALQAPFIWEINSGQLGPGQWQAQVAAAGFAEVRQADFEIISPAAATAAQRSAAAYVGARVAASRNDTTEAIRLAQETINLGSSLDYDVMASHRLLGDLYAGKGNLRLAIDAYRQAIAIADSVFPKSRIPVLLQPRIDNLERILEGLE